MWIINLVTAKLKGFDIFSDASQCVQTRPEL